jgi:hypothetical protein
MKIILYLSIMVMMVPGIYAQSTQVKMDTTKWPHASVDGKTGSMTKEELMNAKGIVLSDTSLKVTEFKFSIAGKGVNYQEFATRGSELNEQMKEALKDVQPGAKIYIEYIKYSDREGKINHAMPITIQLK